MGNTKRNILVVGGAGYVGGSVTDLLLQMSGYYNVIVYDSLLYEESFRKPVELVCGDILDTKKLKPLLDWADCVIWLAAIVGDGACKLDPVLTNKINQGAIEWLSKNFNGRIIFTSTCSVYGAQNQILDENFPLAPLSLYAQTKVKAEQILKNKNAIIFRLGTLFGVSDTFSRIRMDLILNLLTVKAYSTNKINIFGGEQYRPLLHVRDAAQAIVEAIEYSDQAEAQIFNIAKVNMKMIDLAQRIKKYFPKTKIEITEMPFEDTRNYQVSWGKAKKYLNFNPLYSIDFGIDQLAEILNSRRIKDYNNVRYSNQVFLKDVLSK